MPTLTTLYSFDGDHGAWPYSGLIADAQGNLFGTTQAGGTNSGPGNTNGYGTLFELVKTSTGYSYKVLYNFEGTQGANPIGPLMADARGNLFGTTESGGTNGYGTVFELVKTSTGYTHTVLYSGESSFSGLIADAQGNLFGTTRYGGGGHGTVFELVKTSTGYTPAVLYSFDGINGDISYSGLIADAQGNLFGTTGFGGASNYGTVFELVKTSAGYTHTVLYSFDGIHGENPYSGLIADARGNLFGTTESGGTNGYGTRKDMAAVTLFGIIIRDGERLVRGTTALTKSSERQ